MTEGTSRKRRWLHRAGEAFVIVFSILLALFAEAAWNYRGDRIEEAELLGALRTEFEGASREIGQDLAARAAILDRIDGLLGMREERPSAAQLDSVPGYVSALLDWRFYTPAHAVLDDVMSSGRLELIRSTAVRRALMGYVQQSGRLKVLDDLERGFVVSEMEPYLARHLALDRLMGPEPAAAAERVEAGRVAALMADDTFASLVRLRRLRTEEASAFAGYVQRAIGRVRDVLEEGG